MKEYIVKVYSDHTEWYNLEGQCHREDGPAIEHSDGTKAWWINGKLHREDGPAVDASDGFKMYCINGKLHREDGPAVEWTNGNKEWWLNGEKLTEEEFIQRTRPAKELTVSEVSKLLGYEVKIVK